MILIIRNILSLNEKLAYNLVGKLRQLIAPLFDLFLSFQQKYAEKIVNENIFNVKESLLKIIPKVTKTELNKILSNEERQNIIFYADRVLEHKFEILSEQVKFQNKIDWHLDFKSGFQWERGKLYSRYNQVDLKNNADVKFPRELSRCHHFLTLGEAYILTGDEKYTKEFISQIISWIKENPFKRSINWGCSMDIAIRATNWIYSLRMFINSSLISDDLLKEFFSSLYLHGRFIYENPEKNRVYNHNHYLSDLAGQILISLLFNDIDNKEVRSWKDNGLYELYREIRVQILPTGFSYEKTTNYHRLVTELITYTIIVLKNNQIEIPQDILFRIKKMHESILYYMFSDGTAPIIGDQDSGRFLPFYHYDINYQKYLLNVGAVLFNDGIFKNYSGKNNIDVLFLFGKKGLQQLKDLEKVNKQIRSKSFSDAGFYIMRSDKVYLFINNSGLSHYNEVNGGTHTHSDLLSFVYAYNDTPFLIDPGTYVYSSSPKKRMKFRSTFMHNTITVDDFNQNDLKENELWSFNRNSIPREIAWETSNRVDIYEGSHTGYLRLEDPVLHTRKFELNKINDILTIIDKIKSKGKHFIKCHFHFDENVDIKIIDKIIKCKNGSENINISFRFNSETDFTL